jgi:hypothetical protein
MISTFNVTDNLYSLDLPNSPRIKRFAMSLAYSDPGGTGERNKAWLLVGNEREDKRFDIFKEDAGDLGDLLRKAIDWKDRLQSAPDGKPSMLVFFNDSESKRATANMVLQHDGLFFYRLTQTTIGKVLHDTDRWKHFRDQNCRAYPAPVHPEIIADISGGFDRLTAMRDKIILSKKHCPVLLKVLDSPDRAEIINHPITHAAIYLGLMLSLTQAPEKSINQTKKSENTYREFMP